MKQRLPRALALGSLSTLVSLVCTVRAQGGEVSMQESPAADADWISLFDGETLAGWSVQCHPKDRDRTFWMVDRGSLLCDSIGHDDHGYIWLQSDREFGDFELRLEFQVARAHRGNSGVQIRSRYDETAKIGSEKGHPGWLDGPQADIDPNQPWRNGLLYDETREHRRWIHPSLKDSRITRGEHAPDRVVFYYEDEAPGWNELIILCRGTRIRTWVNDVPVSDYDGTGILDDEHHRRHRVGLHGHIALQLHKHSQNRIRFRDIQIRERN